MVKLAQLIWRRCEMVTWFAENVSKCFERIWPNWKLHKVWSGHRNIRNIQEYVDVGQNLKGTVLAPRENLDLNIIYWSVINAATNHRCRIGWRTFGCKCKVGKSDHQEGRSCKEEGLGAELTPTSRDHFTRWTLQRPWPLDDPGGFISNWKSVKQEIKNLKNWLQWEHQFSEGSQKEHSRSKLGIYWRINYSRVQSRKHIKSAKNIWRRRQEEWGRSCSQHIPRWPWWPRPPWSRPGWTLLPSTSW